MSISTFADVSFYHTMKYAHYTIRLLVTCALVEVWVIHAICVVSQSCMLCQILSPYFYTVRARAAPSRIPLQHCKMYGGKLKIGLQPSKCPDSPLNILENISGSGVCHGVLLLLLLWFRFLSPFLISTLMSLYGNNQQIGWIVYSVEYSPEYRHSLMWTVTWHYLYDICQRDQVVHSTVFHHTNQVIDVTRLCLYILAWQNGCQDWI